MPAEKLKINTKITSIEDAAKALQNVEKSFNKLVDKINSPAEKELKETEGDTGDIQVTQNKDKSYTFEVKTDMGWKTPVVGETVIKFKDKIATFSKEVKKSIDEIETDDTNTGDTKAKKTIYDEKADKFVLPRADYDSGWTADGTSALTHGLNTQDFSLVYVSHNNASDNTTSNIFNNKGGTSPRTIVATTSANAISVTVSNGLDYYRIKLWK